MSRGKFPDIEHSYPPDSSESGNTKSEKLPTTKHDKLVDKLETGFESREETTNFLHGNSKGRRPSIRTLKSQKSNSSLGDLPEREDDNGLNPTGKLAGSHKQIEAYEYDQIWLIEKDINALYTSLGSYTNLGSEPPSLELEKVWSIRNELEGYRGDLKKIAGDIARLKGRSVSTHALTSEVHHLSKKYRRLEACYNVLDTKMGGLTSKVLENVMQCIEPIIASNNSLLSENTSMRANELKRRDEDSKDMKLIFAGAISVWLLISLVAAKFDWLTGDQLSNFVKYFCAPPAALGGVAGLLRYFFGSKKDG